MQALFLFALFGVFMATVGGIIGLNTSSIPLMIAREQQAQQQAFEGIQTVVVKQLVREHMQTPGATTTANVSSFLCNRQELRLVVSCSGSSAVDFWGRALRGFIKRESAQTFVSSNSRGLFAARAPVTAFALVSAGPDGRIDPRLQADLSALSTTSTLAQTQQIRAYREASGTPASDSLDDIVLTFSDLPAQQRNWDDVQTGMNRMAVAAMRNYQTQFKVFSSKLPDVYVNQFKNGTVNVNDTLLKKWQSAGASGAPTLVAADAYSLGTDDTKAMIERKPGGDSSAGNLVVNVASSANLLDVWLTSNGTTPFTIAGGHSCGSATPINCTRLQLGT